MAFQFHSLADSDYTVARKLFYKVFPKDETGFDLAWVSRISTMSKGIYDSSDKLLGYMLCDVDGWKYTSIKIQYIVVDPEYQRMKLGTRLLQHSLELCTKMRTNLMLIPVNKDHILSWYKKNGFRISWEGKAEDGGVYRLMNVHPYATRSKAHSFSPSPSP
jgi:ribosomal protein S18 acetylase RimI-like enzyme